jgi:hypothetical protein
MLSLGTIHVHRIGSNRVDLTREGVTQTFARDAFGKLTLIATSYEPGCDNHRLSTLERREMKRTAEKELPRQVLPQSKRPLAGRPLRLGKQGQFKF